MLANLQTRAQYASFLHTWHGPFGFLTVLEDSVPRFVPWLSLLLSSEEILIFSFSLADWIEITNFGGFLALINPFKILKFSIKTCKACLFMDVSIACAASTDMSAVSC